METTVLAHVSWRRFLAYAIGPLVLLVVAGLLVSDKSLGEIFSWNNWLQPTRNRPSPFVAITSVIAYFGILGYKTIKLCRLKGEFMLVRDGQLVIENKTVLSLRDIDPLRVGIRRGVLGKTLRLGLKAGGERSFHVDLAKMDDHHMIAELRRLVENAV